MNKLHFSSKTDDWATPVAVFKELNEKHHFEWDVCASAANTKVGGRFFDKEQDGLAQSWHKTAEVLWMNPPYGREIGLWVKKAYEEAAQGCKVVCLLPARTDTRWFHNYCTKSNSIEFIKGRIKFGNAKNSAPFPSMVVVFDGRK